MGIERKNNVGSFETLRLNSTGICSRSETAHVMLWMHDRAVHEDFLPQ